MNKSAGILVLALALILSGCNSSPDVSDSTEGTPFPTPTFHGLFMVDEGTPDANLPGTGLAETTPTIAAFFMKNQSPTPQPTRTASPTVVPEISEYPLTDTISKTIYADSFNPNWRLERGSDVDITIRSRDISKEGKYAIIITPKEAESRSNFIVTQDSKEIYPREQILGIRFWINPGDGYLEPDDLTVTVLGSDEFPYYVEGDNSVTSTLDPVFSETRLLFLGFNRSIPPFTWAEVIVWLDDLIYDPYYENVVGFYIKNDIDFLQPFYVDDVRLILTDDQPLPTRNLD